MKEKKENNNSKSHIDESKEPVVERLSGLIDESILQELSDVSDDDLKWEALSEKYDLPL